MIKKAIALITLVSLASVSFAQQAPKMISVDMDRLFNEFYEVKQAEAALKTAIDEVRIEIAEMDKTAQPKGAAYEEQVARVRNEGLTEEARREAAGKARELEIELRQFQQEKAQFEAQQNKVFSDRRNSIINQNLEKIRAVVSQYAESNGADLVVNSADVSAFAFVSGSYDHTESVLAILNADAPAETVTE